jgi:tetraacyldisaccharide 4'-kinase
MKALAVLYGALTRLRNWLYDRRLLPVRRASVPVISVGSLTVGGAGKTPFTLLLAEALRGLGAHVAILSRGYRGALEHRGARVTPEHTAAEVGDEPRMMANRLPDVPIYVGADRARMGRLAVAEGAELLLLDDGFQHRRLARDLDVVLVEAGVAPSALALLPAGRLREAAGGLARAHLLVVRGEGPLPVGWSGPVIRVRDEAMAMARHPGGERTPLEALQGRRVTLLAALARPERFAALARSLGAEVVEERFFRDHHPFREGEVAEPKAEILTTEKDAVRLPRGAQAWVLLHRLRITEGEELLRTLLERVLRR